MYLLEYKQIKECAFLGCIAGYQPPVARAEPCTACPIGTYKQDIGFEQCTDCPDGMTTIYTGRTSVDECGK